MAIQNLLVTAAFDSINHFEKQFTSKQCGNEKQNLSFYATKFESEKRYCQIRFSDCVFQLGIILPAWT